MIALAASGAVLLLRCTKDNMTLLFLFAIVGGTGTVLNTSISKLCQMPFVKASWMLLIPLMAIYLGLAALCLVAGAAANTRLEDPSVFVPISTGVNLVLNALAGICIW